LFPFARASLGVSRRWPGAELNPDLAPPDVLDADAFRSLFDQGPNGAASRGGNSPRYSRSDGTFSGGGGGQSSVSNANSGYANSRGGRGGGGGGRAKGTNEVPSFPFLARCLGRAEMLPAIVFIFSRNGCDKAAAEVARHQSVSLTAAEAAELKDRLAAFEAATAGKVNRPRR
jgi:hypothetical protein